MINAIIEFIKEYWWAGLGVLYLYGLYDDYNKQKQQNQNNHFSPITKKNASAWIA